MGENGHGSQQPETASRQLDRKRETRKWQWERKPQTGTDPDRPKFSQRERAL
jgi:hypothetical protein